MWQIDPISKTCLPRPAVSLTPSKLIKAMAGSCGPLPSTARLLRLPPWAYIPPRLCSSRLIVSLTASRGDATAKIKSFPSRMALRAFSNIKTSRKRSSYALAVMLTTNERPSSFPTTTHKSFTRYVSLSASLFPKLVNPGGALTASRQKIIMPGS